ncbi:hypothetical protein V1503_23845 [Bacillus sp. SCS-151]|uniref:hypothetical protein n=1 Tax=Nanhaiella sioensis TaxID=3115293 RepID=UPI00397A91DD
MKKIFIKTLIGLILLILIAQSYLIYEKIEKENQLKRDLYLQFIDNEISFANQINVLSDATVEGIMDPIPLNILTIKSFSLLEYTKEPLRPYLGFSVEFLEFMLYSSNEVNHIYNRFLTKTLTQDDLNNLKELISTHQEFIKGMDNEYIKNLEKASISDIREDLQKRMKAINEES